jgi:hypothetical protein
MVFGVSRYPVFYEAAHLRSGLSLLLLAVVFVGYIAKDTPLRYSSLICETTYYCNEHVKHSTLNWRDIHVLHQCLRGGKRVQRTFPDSCASDELLPRRSLPLRAASFMLPPHSRRTSCFTRPCKPHLKLTTVTAWFIRHCNCRKSRLHSVTLVKFQEH